MIKKSLLTAALALSAINAMPQAEPMDSFIDKLMSDMTIDEKIGQLNLQMYWSFELAMGKDVEAEKLDMIRSGQMGGIYGVKDVEKMKIVQQAAVESPHSIPLLFGMDVVHGSETTFPIPLALSTSWNMDLIERAASMAAREATAQGINWVFSPMVDISRDPRWGRISEEQVKTLISVDRLLRLMSMAIKAVMET